MIHKNYLKSNVTFWFMGSFNLDVGLLLIGVPQIFNSAFLGPQ